MPPGYQGPALWVVISMNAKDWTALKECGKPEAASQRKRRGANIAAGALAMAAVLATAACANGASALGTRTARITIDGKDVGAPFPISCRQQQWVWQIETVGQSPGFTAQIRTGEAVVPLLVRITDMGGFTGVFAADNLGAADATFDNGIIRTTGTAEGFDEEPPFGRVTARFAIAADC